MKKIYYFVLGLSISIILLTGCVESFVPHTHQYTENTVQPTCTEKGYTEQICTCGAVSTSYEIEALGHIYKNKLCTGCGKEQEISEGLEYKLSDDGSYYTIIGKGTCKDIYLYIPSTHENIPIKSIGTHAFWQTEVKSIVFEEDSSLTTLETNALTGANGLEEIILPNSLISIGPLAFQSCDLKYIHIPENVSYIGARAFFNCFGLENITVSEDNNFFKSIDGTLYSKDGTQLIQHSLAKAKTDFLVPEGVENILDGAFSSCDSIVSVTMPNTVQYISGETFRWCDNLESVQLSQNIKSISSFAFDGCINLKNVSIPKDTYYIADSAFRYCSSLEYINVDDDNLNYKTADGSLYSKDGTTLVQYALGKTDESFTTPNTVVIIGNNAFYGCKTIKEVIMSDNVNSVGETAFRECGNLETVVLSNNIKVIKDGTFYDCKLLQNITLPLSIVEIEQWAFSHCAALKSINIPSSCTKIGKNTFAGCSGLESISFNSSNNWVAYETEDFILGNEIDYNLLQNGNEAKKLLTEVYCGYYWIKR